MFSPKYLALTLSISGIASGGSVGVWTIKNSKLKNQIEVEIRERCGEVMEEWYTSNGEKNFDGRDLTRDGGNNAWWKENSKGNSGSNYVFDCKPEVIKKYNVTDEWLNRW